MDDLDITHTRFGSVPIRIMWPDGSLSMPDFGSESITNTRHVPGSDRNITQMLGKGPKTVTYRLELDTRADFRALEAKVQETDTLVLFAQMTAESGTYVDIHGEGYLEIANVTLISLGATPQIYPDGTVEIDATFQRASS